MKKLGRDWYQVKWTLCDSSCDDQERDQLAAVKDLPVIIDVLAKSHEQAKAIAKECHPALLHVQSVLVFLRGTERQFQKQEEPEGEENLDLLPY